MPVIGSFQRSAPRSLWIFEAGKRVDEPSAVSELSIKRSTLRFPDEG